MPNPQLENIRKLLSGSLLTTQPSLEQMRLNLDTLGGSFPALPEITRESVDIAGGRAEWLRPTGAAAERTIVYAHGGGYMLGSLESHRDLASRIAVAAAADVLSFDYPLAPESPFPAGLDRATAVVRWLVANGRAPAKLAFVGDSAGAGLLLATAIRLRDAGEPLPAAMAFMSPWVDLTCTATSIADADDPIMQAPVVNAMAAAYIGAGSASDPLVSPVLGDLAGLPPMLVQVGTHEGLRDDGELLRERASAVGVDVEFQAWDEMFHVFQYFAMMLDDGQRAIDAIGAYLQARL